MCKVAIRATFCRGLFEPLPAKAALVTPDLKASNSLENQTAFLRSRLDLSIHHITPIFGYLDSVCRSWTSLRFPDISDIGFCTFCYPEVTIPDVEVETHVGPAFCYPEITIPDVEVETHMGPAFCYPEVTIPDVEVETHVGPAFCYPEVTIPDVELETHVGPAFFYPEVTIPDVEVETHVGPAFCYPEVTIPDVELETHVGPPFCYPEVTIPDVELETNVGPAFCYPEVNIPDVEVETHVGPAFCYPEITVPDVEMDIHYGAGLAETNRFLASGIGNVIIIRPVAVYVPTGRIFLSAHSSARASDTRTDARVPNCDTGLPTCKHCDTGLPTCKHCLGLCSSFRNNMENYYG
ncbi:hypothetical protein J6590_066166 [Homalodisca vitripennis]|nr:hypothetical protein J6590_066166 [Homalodisca vitripennis]